MYDKRAWTTPRLKPLNAEGAEGAVIPDWAGMAGNPKTHHLTAEHFLSNHLPGGGTTHEHYGPS